MKYIYHISDIHIRPASYINIRSSFTQLVEAIVPNRTESILVIAGDIFENKTFLTTEDIYMFFWMMDALETNDIATIVVPGNHDYNINSPLLSNNLDVLLRKYTNVVCLSETQIYREFPDIDLYVFSPIDKKLLEIDDQNKIKVAILHEPVCGALYDNEQNITDGRFAPSDLDDWDYVLLGDIHRPQFLTPKMAYSGSFVQKNKGEGIDHGYVLWDLTRGVGQHHFIPLKQIYLKVDAVRDQCTLPKLEPWQNVVYICLIHNQCTDAYLAKLRATIEQTFGNINKIVNKNNYIKSYDLKDDAAPRDIDVSAIFVGLLEKVPSSAMKQRIHDYHNANIQNRAEYNATQYTLNYMSWSNILCYGENNYLDFRSFTNKIVVINGNNKHGKSSIIDILIRILFNECYRGYKDDIVNKRKSRGEIKLSFSIGDVEYVIEQIIYNKNTHTSTKHHKLFKIIGDSREDVTKDSINNTYKYLRHDLGIGDFKNFVNMTTALQNRNFLVDLDKKDMLGLLTKILDIDILSDLEKSTKSEINFIKRTNKAISDKLKELAVDPRLEEYVALFEKNTKNIERLTADIDKINAELRQLHGRLIPTRASPTLHELVAHQAAQLKGFAPRNNNCRDRLNYMLNRAGVLEGKLGPRHSEIKVDNVITKEKYEQNVVQISKLNDTTVRPKSDEVAEWVKNEDHYRKYLDTHTYYDTRRLYNSLKECDIKNMTLDELRDIEYSKEQYGMLKQEIKSLSELVTPIERVVYTKLTEAELERIANSKTEPDAELQQMYRPCFIKSTVPLYRPDDIDDYDAYKNMVDDTSPADRCELERRIADLRCKIDTFNLESGALKFDDNCDCCRENKVVVERVFDTDAEAEQLQELIAKMRDLPPYDLDTIKRKIAAIEEYKINKEQNENLEFNNRILYTLNCRRELRKIYNIKAHERLNKLRIIEQKVLRKNNLKILALIQQHDAANAKLDTYAAIIRDIENYKNYVELERLKRENEIFDIDANNLLFHELIGLRGDIAREQEYFRLYDVFVDHKANLEHVAAADKNKAIDKQITKLDGDLARYSAELSKQTAIRDKLLTRINSANAVQSRRAGMIDERKANMAELEMLEIYFNCIEHRSGIPSIVLQNVCQLLNDKMNGILNKITDFEVEVSYDKEFKIYTVENDTRIPADMASGYQKFIIDMIMRVIMTNISVLSSPNIIFIDEGFGCLDKENFIEVARALRKLKNNFTSIFIISHINELKSYADASIQIKRVNTYSTLTSGVISDEEKQLCTPIELKQQSDKLKRFKKKNVSAERIDEFIQTNDIEAILIVKGDSTFVCKGCNATFSCTRTNTIARHISAKKYARKHRSFISTMIDTPAI